MIEKKDHLDSKSNQSRITTSDLKGLTNLLTDAIVGTTELVEAMNRRIVHPSFLPSTPVQKFITGFSGLVYNSIRLSTKVIGGGLATAFEQLPSHVDLGLSSAKKETLLAVVNGVAGDYLSQNENSLAVSMQFRYQGKKIPLDTDRIARAYPTVNGKILLIVHGLCMNDLQWNQQDHNHGESLAQELGMTPIYLHYNSGLHISQNGQDFNLMLEALLQTWPVAVKELTIVAHSMGGLISRSAFHYGQKEQKSWTQYLKNLVFLGSPHHGAPLERIGNYVDHLFEAIPYVKPFARLGKIRSAGITDLRVGKLLQADWEGKDRFHPPTNANTHIPLPEKVQSYAIAAYLGKKQDKPKNRILGDGLVRMESALGQHKDSSKSLDFPEENTWVVYETGHLGLLSSKEVYEQLKKWLFE